MANDPYTIFKMVLEEKIKFPKSFDKDAKSLVKHLCQHDISKRYGNLVDGVKDIKNHRFFKNFDFEAMVNQRLQAPCIPQKEYEREMDNFSGSKSLPE